MAKAANVVFCHCLSSHRPCWKECTSTHIANAMAYQVMTKLIYLLDNFNLYLNYSFSALLGVKNDNPSPESGLPFETLGINGINQCISVSNMPSTNILDGNALVLVDSAIYSFGGRASDRFRFASTTVYRYDLNTDTWVSKPNLTNYRRSSSADRISENEILLTGTNSQ